MAPRLGAALALGAMRVACVAFVVGPALLAGSRAFACSLWEASPEGHPSLAHEQTLILFEPERSREHQITRIAIRRGSGPLGFLLSAPTRPEISEVARDPFAGLRSEFPFSPKVPPSFPHSPPAEDPAAPPFGSRRPRAAVPSLPEPGRGASEQAAPAFAAAPAGVAAARGEVDVLEMKDVGSFTIFVLAPCGAGALGRWLERERIEIGARREAWLRRQAELGFYVVAFRYEPARAALRDARAGAALTRAETYRISFDSPLPFLAYAEAERPRGLPLQPARLAELWLVSPWQFAPVARQRQGAGARWVQPLRPGMRYDGARPELEALLGRELGALLPPGELAVQSFQDQKRGRTGFGDILFAPRDPLRYSASRKARLAALFGVSNPLFAGAPALRALPIVATDPGEEFRARAQRSLYTHSLAAKVYLEPSKLDARLSRSSFERSVRLEYGRIRLCYESALGLHPDIEGRLETRITIDPRGNVRRVENLSPGFRDPAMIACIERCFRGLDFPAFDHAGGSAAATATTSIYFAPPRLP